MRRIISITAIVLLVIVLSLLIISIYRYRISTPYDVLCEQAIWRKRVFA